MSQTPVNDRTAGDVSQPAPSRRGFFFGAAAVGAAAAAATSLRQVAPEPQAVAQAVKAPDGGGGYHESAHVQRYYQTTRI